MAELTKPVVALFDVDETLVHTGRSGASSWLAAFQKLYGIPADIGEHTSAGETDPQVARATFRGVLGRDPAPDELGRLYAQYLLHLADDIWTSEGYRVLPGAEQTLMRLGEVGVMLGLVSGAMEGAARTKLMPANLNRLFVFGGYGSDSPDRSELTRLAMDKAARLHGQLTPAQVYVVGDTPHEMAMPVEKSGQDEFELAYGDTFAEHIDAFDPDRVKVLSRYNPEGDSSLNRRQEISLVAGRTIWHEPLASYVAGRTDERPHLAELPRHDQHLRDVRRRGLRGAHLRSGGEPRYDSENGRGSKQPVMSATTPWSPTMAPAALAQRPPEDL